MAGWACAADERVDSASHELCNRAHPPVITSFLCKASEAKL